MLGDPSLGNGWTGGEADHGTIDSCQTAQWSGQQFLRLTPARRKLIDTEEPASAGYECGLMLLVF